MTRSEKAVYYFNNKFNCSQSVLTAFGTDLGLNEDCCLKVSCAFGGGMGRQQHVCGAVTGALMALGLKYGKAINDDDSKKIHTYSKTKELLNQFSKNHGSINCKELLNGLDMQNENDAKEIERLKFHETKCKLYVMDAVAITENLIQ